MLRLERQREPLFYRFKLETIACCHLQLPCTWFLDPHSLSPGFPTVFENSCGFAGRAEFVVTHDIVGCKLTVSFRGKPLEAGHILRKPNSYAVVKHLTELLMHCRISGPACSAVELRRFRKEARGHVRLNRIYT